MAKKNQSKLASSINAILLSPTKKVEEATGPLSSLFRQYLLKAGWDVASYSMAIDRWVKRKHPNDPTQQMSLKGNTNEQLASPNMTLHSFLRGLEILDPAYATMKLQIHTHSGHVIDLQSVLDNTIVREFWDPLYKTDWDNLEKLDELSDIEDDD